MVLMMVVMLMMMRTMKMMWVFSMLLMTKEVILLLLVVVLVVLLLLMMMLLTWSNNECSYPYIHASVSRYAFWELFYFVSDMPCSFSGEFHCALLLVHVGEAVCGSLLCQVLVLWLNDCLPLLWVIFVKQLGEYPAFCSVLFHTEGCSLFMPYSSGLVKLMSGELCSWFAVVLHVCI